MKTILTICVSIFLLLQNSVTAQENMCRKIAADHFNTGAGFGFQLVQYQRDFGLGVNVVSPYFANDNLGVRLKSNLMFNQPVLNNTTEWIPYSNVSLGVVSVAGHIGEDIRLYGEGGAIALFPSREFSSADIVMGGYGLFGFEFFFCQGGNYFIEIGGIGTGAVADKDDTRPIYSNGMTIGTGFRFFLK